MTVFEPVESALPANLVRLTYTGCPVCLTTTELGGRAGTK